MKLQHKAWGLILVIVLLSALGAMLGTRVLVADSFERLERERVEREGERAKRVLDQAFQSLTSTVRDYAYWGDAVRFLDGKAPRFFSENFDTGNMGYLRISEVAVLKLSGKVMASAALEDGELMPVTPEHLQELRTLLSPLLGSPKLSDLLQTYHVRDGRLEFVTAAVVHDPGRVDGGPRGIIVMVRRLDETELARFSEVLMAPLRISLEHPDHNSAQSMHIEPAGADVDELHAVLSDSQGRPLAELVMGLDSKLQQQQRALTRAGIAAMAFAGLSCALVLAWLLDRLLLRRLQKLHADVARITDQGPVHAEPVHTSGDDELRQLAESINSLLARVRRDAQAQGEAHQQHEQLQLQLLQSQKTEALGRLTGGIAHDFNNSLAAITGWVRLAAEDLQDEPDHPSTGSLQQALKATRYADGLMRQLLAFGRQTPPKLRRLHWSSLIEETRQMVASGLTKDCELRMDYRAEHDEVDADPTQLQQVMVNLLINASDAMKGRGRIDLTLSALDLPLPHGQRLPPGAQQLPPGHYVTLKICDNGPGVPADHLGRVFDPFFTTKGKGRGTGLGLSVAHGIVLRHHGGIGVENSAEGGACFYVHLPLSRRDADVDPVTAPDGGPGRGRQVLFVDDDQLVRHAWSSLLERQGWQVTRARDGEEAWDQFAKTGRRFDLILTDQSMPRLDGVGLARRIREADEPPPIILISGHLNEVGAGDLQTLFNAVLHKPVDTGELGRVIDEVLATGTTRF